MSNYERKPGTGTIFKNDYKSQENHPDYRGSIVDLDGKECDISLWVKKSQKGTSYFSVNIQEPYKKELGVDSRPAPEETKEGLVDDLPF